MTSSVPPSPPPARGLVVSSRLAAVWALGYALYRGYYALGGTWAILGTPASHAQWIRINAIAAVLLLGAAVFPLATVGMWRNSRVRPFLLVIAWVVSVGCVSHALIAISTRVASLMGWLTIDYPFWETIDARKADLQDLFFNEPWFLIEGLSWAAVAWFGALRTSARRWSWIGSAVAATAAATVFGMLTSLGTIEPMIIGGTAPPEPRPPCVAAPRRGRHSGGVILKPPNTLPGRPSGT